MTLEETREKIDRIDAQLVALFNERLDLAADVAAAKAAAGRPIYDPTRERAKLYDIVHGEPPTRAPQMTAFFSLLMSMSKAEQQRLLSKDDPASPSHSVRAAFEELDVPFPQAASVACQGVEGAYSQIAADRIFSVPKISYFGTFEGVFRAVRDGFCEYGVLPIENSTAGSVNAVYDLLAKYSFFIVRSLRLKIDHNLMGLPGASKEGITEVYSHSQAINQCSDYLERLGAHVNVRENTAMSAEMVAKSGRLDWAALASRSAAKLYDLTILDEDVQDSDNNYTRFVVVSSEPHIFPGANRSSLMLTLKHEPGSLYRVLERFYALDINLVKLESRPIPGRDFEFAFYFDVESPVGSASFQTLMDSLSDVCASCTYFGSYMELL